MNPSFSILLPTNGHPDNEPALRYGLELALLLKVPVLLLGVIEEDDENGAVQDAMEAAGTELARAGVEFRMLSQRGRGSKVIAEIAQAGSYLTVVGPLGRPAWRRAVQGRSFRRILERLPSPLLYVPQLRWPIRRMLLCLGGLEYASSMVQSAMMLAGACSARVSFLHVVEPVNLAYPVAREVHDHWRDILNTDTPQGRNLREALESARQAGLAYDFKVRQGSVVHEILDEVRHGSYDLIGMGSPHSTHSLRHMYMPNVTAEVAEGLDRPVLVARFGKPLGE